MPRILILATGGTIASKESPQGLMPEIKGQEMMRHLGSAADYELEVHDICRWIVRIYRRRSGGSLLERLPQSMALMGLSSPRYRYDGVHRVGPGLYAAQLPKPVVLTGSQIPIHNPLTDAKSNLYLALAMASSKIPGVFVAFANEVILGTRAVKVRTLDFEAFDSINLPPLARANSIGLDFNQDVLEQVKHYYNPDEDFCLKDEISTDVFLMKLTPGLRPEVFAPLVQLGYKAFYLEAFGIGGIHYLHHDLVTTLDHLIKQGIHVVVGSQCLYERSDFSIYDTGRRLLEIGAIEAFDMTSEAAFVKLMWSLAQTSNENVPRLFMQDLAGEVRVRKSYEALMAQSDPKGLPGVQVDSDR